MHKREGGRIAFFALAVGAMSLLGCSGDEAKKEAANLKPCRGGCTRPNVCVRPKKGAEGTCVYPCAGNKQCPAGLRCTGRYAKSYLAGLSFIKGKGYCQKADVPVGGVCGVQVGLGCQEGSHCFKGNCVKTCRDESTCAPDQRCVEVVKKDRYSLPWMKKKLLYKGCVTATKAKGARCDPQTPPLCARGHACLGGRCVATCEKRGGACAAGTKCVPIKTKVGFLGKMKTVMHACAPATLPEGSACNSKRWPLCASGARCLRKKCARECRKTKDCAEGTKCIRITRKVGILKNKIQTLYRACVPATKTEGQACQSGKWPLCAPKHACMSGKCARTCRKHADCAQGRACLGRAYRGPAISIPLRKMSNDRANFYYCLEGSRSITARANYGKCRRGRDCLKDHVCLRGRCRPFCQADRDCPKYMGMNQRCRNLRSKSGKRLKACTM